MKRNNKGFSLVELIVVIVILAILIGVTIGGIYSYVNKARRNTDINNCKVIHTTASTLLLEQKFVQDAVWDLNHNNTFADYKAGLCSPSQIGGIIIAWSENMPVIGLNYFNGNGKVSWSKVPELASQYVSGSWQTASQNFGNAKEIELFWTRLNQLFPDGFPACKEKDKVMFLAIYSTGNKENPLDIKVGTVDKSKVMGTTYSGSFGIFLDKCDKIYLQDD